MKRQRLTFIEFVFILCFIFIVLGFVMPRLGGSHDAPISSTQAYIVVFKTSLTKFQVDCGRLPTTEEGLAALAKKPPAIAPTLWRGPYLNPEDSRLDPWGHPFIYKCPGVWTTNGYDVYSLGPNGKGGDEAIGNWDLPVARQ